MKSLQPDFFLDFLKPGILKRLLHPRSPVTLSVLAEFLQDLGDCQEHENAPDERYAKMRADCLMRLSDITIFDTLGNFINVDAFTRANIATIVYSIAKLCERVNVSDMFL